MIAHWGIAILIADWGLADWNTWSRYSNEFFLSADWVSNEGIADWGIADCISNEFFLRTIQKLITPLINIRGRDLRPPPSGGCRLSSAKLEPLVPRKNTQNRHYKPTSTIRILVPVDSLM